MSPRSSSVMMALLVVVFATLLSTNSALSLDREKREESAVDNAAPTTTEVPKIQDCKSVCGWAVYKPITREILYYMKNKMCNCPQGTMCLRTMDDLSVSAYVYHCRKPPA